jgi:Uma2 family endonuclease
VSGVKVLAPPRAAGRDLTMRSSTPVVDTGGVDSPADGWTVADLDLLPDDGRRYEIIDGSLVMSPTPTAWHQRVVRWLTNALLVGVPDGFDVLENMGVQLAEKPGQVLIPDACAVRTPEGILDDDRALLLSEDVLLAVEVVSRSSRSIDRLLKPRLYAQAGIPSFWRVEREAGGGVHAFSLADPDSGEYTASRVVRPGETAILEAPWPVTLIPTTRESTALSA